MPGSPELATLPSSDQVGLVPIFCARAKYDFAIEGGVVGAISLLAASLIPSGALILGASMRVITAPTSGGSATVAVSVEGANDIITAAAISGAPWSTTGDKAVTKTWATAPIRTTAARNVTATVAVADLTAGVFEVFVYFLPAGF